MSSYPFRNIECYDASVKLAEVIRFISDYPDMLESLRSETLNRVDELEIEGGRNKVHEMLWGIVRQEKICELNAEKEIQY